MRESDPWLTGCVLASHTAALNASTAQDNARVVQKATSGVLSLSVLWAATGSPSQPNAARIARTRNADAMKLHDTTNPDKGVQRNYGWVRM